jgi:signal transduction histidine kinase
MLGLKDTFKRLSQTLRTPIYSADSAALIWLRWLVCMNLLFFSLYIPETGKWGQMFFPLAMTGLYALSNVALTIYPKIRWRAGIFLFDLVIVGIILYGSVGLDSNLFLTCFSIVYLATLSKRVKDTFVIAFFSSILYTVLTLHRNRMDLTDSRLLLRFPFFFILALLTSYLAEETEKTRQKVQTLTRSATRLMAERDEAVIELRKKEEDLIQAEKMSAMGHLSGALAHEIRNPLCVVVGYTGEIIASLKEDDPLKPIMQTILRCGNRCNELVDNLLRFSRIPKNEEVFHINEVIEDAMVLAKLAAQKTPVKMLSDFHDDLFFQGHRSEIQQIILNLCTNAIDAMPGGGIITIRTAAENVANKDWICISVQDTGAGIPPEIQEKIFNPFFTTKEPGKGTGLGLSIISDIVRKYDGTIEVKSEVGLGTKFIIRLPVAKSPEPVEA